MPVVGYVNDIIYMFGQISYHVADVIVILATRVDGELREICLRLGIVPGCGSRSLWGWVRPDYTSGPSRAHIQGIRASAGTQIVEARQCASAVRLARVQVLGARIHNVDRSSCITLYTWQAICWINRQLKTNLNEPINCATPSQQPCLPVTHVQDDHQDLFDVSDIEDFHWIIYDAKLSSTSNIKSWDSSTLCYKLSHGGHSI